MSVLDEAIKFPEWNGHRNEIFMLQAMEKSDNPGLYHAKFTVFLTSNFARRNDILQTLDDNQKLIVISNPKRPFWNAIFHFFLPKRIGKKYKYKVKIIQDDN